MIPIKPAPLAELGYSQSAARDCTSCVDGRKPAEVAEVFQAQLAEVGIKASIEIGYRFIERPSSAGERNTTGTRGSMDMMTWSWYDPDILYILAYAWCLPWIHLTRAGYDPRPDACTDRPERS